MTKQDTTSGTLWMGQPIDEMTAAELREVVLQMARMIAERDSTHAATLSAWSLCREARRAH